MTTSAAIRPPFHADHVGSLLRPAELRQAFRERTQGTISAERFTEIQDKAIRDAIALQEDIGLQSVTDGEFRRSSYWSHFAEGIGGLDVAEARFEFGDKSGERVNFLAPHPTSKLKRPRTLSGEDFDFVKAATSHTPKITLPSPPSMHFWGDWDAHLNAGYADEEEFFDDLAEIYQAEIADLGGRGATYIQIDEVPLAVLCDATVRQGVIDRGDDPDRLVNAYVKLINNSLVGRPKGMTVAMHLCRGNFKGKWLSEGSYQYVAERLFNDINVDAFFLEYDDERSGDFSPLASVPDNKAVVLGLVSSKTPEMESPDDLKRRIDAASKLVPHERLALSPQCGFASVVTGNPVTLDDQVNKLKLIVDVAGQVWR